MNNNNSDNPSLIVRLPNWVGDVIMALPALQALCDAGIQLHLLGKPWIADLLAATPMNLLSLSKRFSDNRRTLMNITCNKSLLFTNSFSSAFLAWSAGKQSIGYRGDARSLLLTHSLNRNLNEHEVKAFWTLAHYALNTYFPELHVTPPPISSSVDGDLSEPRPLGSGTGLSYPNFPLPNGRGSDRSPSVPGVFEVPIKELKTIPNRITLPLKPEWLIKAKQVLDCANIKSPFTVICPAATGKNRQGQSKIWPHWTELANALSEHSLVVCPGKNEEQLCAELLPNATQLTGLNLSLYAAVLALSERVIANDSGPMHIAAAVGQPTLGIFGVSDPVRTAPWGADYVGSAHAWPNVPVVLRALQDLA